jgi:RNA polymerase-binding transcription factor DksA
MAKPVRKKAQKKASAARKPAAKAAPKRASLKPTAKVVSKKAPTPAKKAAPSKPKPESAMPKKEAAKVSPKKVAAPAKSAPAAAKPAQAAVAPQTNGTRPTYAKLAPKPILPTVEVVAPPTKPPYSGEFLERQKQRLLELRDHLLNQMHGVAQDTLRVRAEGSEASAFGMHQADAGSDAYDKDFALSLLSQEQDALYEIEEGLKRVEGTAYGICEMSNKPIPKVRLEAIPYARFTVECQAQLERENKGRRRWDTIPQFMDSAESIVDEEDDSSEEDDRRKEKE